MPTTNVVLGSTATNVGGALTPLAAVTDALDTTWVQIPFGSTRTRIDSANTLFSTGTGIVRDIVPTVRAASVSATSTIRIDVVVMTSGRLIGRFEQVVTTTPTTYTFVAPGLVSEEEFRNTALLITVIAGTTAKIIEAAIGNNSRTTSPVSIVAPTAAQVFTTSSNPELRWTEPTVSGAFNGQTHYEVGIFTAAQYGIAGFDPATSPAWFRTGPVRSPDFWYFPNFNLDDATTWRYYVRVAQTVNGIAVWGAWSNVTFSTAQATTAQATTAVATAMPGYVNLVLTYAAAQKGFMVQRSADAGATWTTVRGQCRAVPTNTPANGHTVTDYEAPLGVPVTYRYASMGPASGGVRNRQFQWYTFNAGASVTLPSATTWITPVYAPTLGRTVRLRETPAWDRERRTAGEFVFPAQESPLIIPDVRSLDSGQLVIQVDSEAEAEALRTVFGQAPLLIRYPATFGERDRYVIPAAQSTERLNTRLATDAKRIVTMKVREIAAPSEIPGQIVFG